MPATVATPVHEQALGHELTRSRRMRPGTEGDTHSELALPRGVARHEKVRDVRARDEQNQRDRGRERA